MKIFLAPNNFSNYYFRAAAGSPDFIFLTIFAGNLIKI